MDADRPVLRRPAVWPGLAGLGRSIKGVILTLSIDVRAGIGRVVQDAHDRRKRRRLPDDLSVSGAAPDLGGERQPLLPKVQQDLVGDAQTVELAEQVVEPARTLRSGSFITVPDSVITKPAGRDRVSAPGGPYSSGPHAIDIEE